MKKIIIGALLLSPSFVFAQEFSNIERLVNSAGNIINTLIPIVAALALLYFFYGLAKFILNRKDNPEAKEEAQGIMVWGVVALFVMMSVWGLVRFIQNAFDIDNQATSQTVPAIRR